MLHMCIVVYVTNKQALKNIFELLAPREYVVEMTMQSYNLIPHQMYWML